MSRLTIIPTLTVLVTTACAGAGSGLLFGGNEPGETAAANETCPSFAGFDTDGDGWIGPAEFDQSASTLFKAWDDTGDGRLTANEFNDCFGAVAEDAFAAFDDNQDKMIDPSEFFDEGLFAAWDGDADGRLGEGEFPPESLFTR